MKVGLFAAFAGRACGGPEIFEREVVRGLVAEAPQHDYHVYCLDQRAPDVIDLPPDRVTYHVLQPTMRTVAMLTSLPAAIQRTQPDVFHAIVMTPPFSPQHMVMHMPCSSLLSHPHLFPMLIRWRLRFLLHRAVPKAALVACPSHHVRDVMQERFHLPDDRLPVVHPGADPMFRPIPSAECRTFVKDHYAIHDPYFFVCGRWEPRKNTVNILKAFAQFKQENRTEHRLVFSGGKSWGYEEATTLIRELNLSDAVVDLGKTPVSGLPYLYGAADALVYASVCEGFGMPIIESMRCATPVITSNVSAMPETAGGAALLIDPASPADIAQAMHRIAFEPGLAERLREQGLTHSASFTWQQTAHDYLQLLEATAKA
jgi:glycosyltransferase involved in cell wall biosynthesis